MERKDFLQGAGLIGLGTVLSTGKNKSAEQILLPYSCTLTASETAGPYPYPGTVPTSYTTSPLYRQNLIGDLPSAGGGGSLTNVVYNGTTYPGITGGGGIGLFLTLTIQSASCVPVSNARVDIWHCDKRGYYSAYNSTQNGGDWSSYTFLRGIQTTDSNGQVNFISIMPSWYVPRAIHFHIQVYYGGTLVLTTQLAIDDTIATTLNSSTGYNRTYPYSNSTDQVFSDGYSTELITLDSNSSNTRGYIASQTLITSITALPLTLTNFTATVQNRDVALSWSSENELNVSRFEIERSANGLSFEKAGAVLAKNTSGTNQYSFKEVLGGDKRYYRLKIIDTDEKYQYSKILVVDGKSFSEASIFPNPVRNKFTVLHLHTDSNTKVKVLNTAGVLIAQQKLPANINQTEFDVSTFAAGTYLLIIETSSDRQILKFTKQ